MNQQIVFLQHPKQTKHYVGQIERQSPRWTGLILFFFFFFGAEQANSRVCSSEKKKILTIRPQSIPTSDLYILFGMLQGVCLCVATVVVCI